jgi:acetyl-CoA/propionyl-CoA carboxylase biotin carboxyl carrier protein
MDDELRPSEVARRLGTSTRTVQRWITQGSLPARRVGGRWRVASDALDAFRPPDPETAAIVARTSRPIRTLFVANRGEIAVRIRRTTDKLGVRSVVPPTDGPEALDLLDVAAVVDAAVRSGADAVHPGFGFLAEHPGFAEAVEGAGLTWVGPPPAAIRAMGDKAAARRLAAGLGIPIPAGYDDADQGDATLIAAAERIGAPLLIKPAAGGGGKGMRTVRDLARLPDELGAARREAHSAFGDDRLILERLIEGARHVEIQVLVDQTGRGVHLGERDCSIQRRHQKVLEEAGSPAVDGELRDRMGAAALRLAGAVGYVGAGTCEFLLDERGAFTFLEMNTRLQVEHPVTELVIGRDLVADQLRIAAGEPLGIDQADVAIDGHAIEARLYAEDADAGFLPATGCIELLRWPAGQGIRVDAGVSAGDEIGGRFDPMLAKIVGHGLDRAEALARLTDALDATVILGLTTNLRFLRWLVREPVFRDGEARTDTLDRIWPPDDWAARTAIPGAAWTTAAALLSTQPARSAETADPWGGPWRLNAPPTVRLEAEGHFRTVVVDPAAPALRAIRVGDTAHVDLAGRSVAFRPATAPDVDRAAEAAAAGAGVGAQTLVAPMPGRVLAIHRPVGNAVVAGDPVITLEAMKMEHVVSATASGTVTDIAVRVSDQVSRGQRLAAIEPAPALAHAPAVEPAPGVEPAPADHDAIPST